MSAQENSLFVIRRYRLGIHIFGEDLQELEEELYDHIAFLWEDYVLEANNKLAPDTQELKISLLETFEEVS